MTAYGRSCVTTPLGRFSVEIQSVNRKHLEVSTFLPREFLRFDVDIKKWVTGSVGRGQVNVKVNVAFEKTTPLVVNLNVPLAAQVHRAWCELSDSLGISCDDRMLMELLSQTDGILCYDDNLKDEQAYKEALFQATEQALKQLVQMKQQEGKALYEDIAARLATLKQAIKRIAEKSPNATTRYREKLKERLQEVLGASIDNEEKILREVCVYAEKIDIEEELTRFHSHLAQMQQLLESEEPSVGKTLEFLIQELNREINTMSAKSSDVDISRAAIEVKTELERIREQIQNIE